MPRHEYTEDDYYGHVRAALDYEGNENPLIDHVASQVEWKRCKAALMRWIAEQDTAYDQAAVDAEHEDEDE